MKREKKSQTATFTSHVVQKKFFRHVIRDLYKNKWICKCAMGRNAKGAQYDRRQLKIMWNISTRASYYITYRQESGYQKAGTSKRTDLANNIYKAWRLAKDNKANFVVRDAYKFYHSWGIEYVINKVVAHENKRQYNKRKQGDAQGDATNGTKLGHIVRSHWKT